jgi:uncharacterized protein (DUF736 family)
MTTTFTKQNDGFTGTVRTLTTKIKVSIVPNEKTKAPDYRVLAGGYEFGAAWKKPHKPVSATHLSVSLDDPSFQNAIYAN